MKETALCVRNWHYGQPILLPDDEMDRVIEGFKSYGPGKTD